MKRNFYANTSPRISFMKMFNYFYMVVTAISLIAYIYLAYYFINDAKTSGTKPEMGMGIILGVAGIPLVSGFVVTFIIAKFLRMDESTIVDNRYFLAGVAFIGGQFIVPIMLLYGMSNVESKSTFSAKIALSKSLGITATISGLVASLITALYFIASGNFEVNNDFIISIAIPGVVCLYGLINLLSFMGYGMFDERENNVAPNFWLAFLSTLNLIVASVVLIYLMIQSVLGFIGSIMRLFSDLSQNRSILGFIQVLFDLFYIVYTYIRMVFICKYASQTIKVIWAKEHVIMNKSEKYETKALEYQQA